MTKKFTQYMYQSMQRRPNFNLVLLLAMFTLFGVVRTASGQDLTLSVTGSVKEGWKKLEGARLQVFKDGKLMDSPVLTAGDFTYVFETNSVYVMDFSMGGFVSKKIEFNTAVPSNAKGGWEPFEFVVELFKEQEGLNEAVFANPVAKIKYEPIHSNFDYDIDYTMEFQNAEEEMFDEFEELQRIRDEEERMVLEEAEKDKAKAEEERLAADKKRAEDLKKAKENFAQKKEALRNQQLAKAQQEKDDKAKIASEAKSEEEHRTLEANRMTDELYAKLISAGDKRIESGNLDAAEQSFQQAKETKPKEKYPQEKLNWITKERFRLKDEQLAKEKEYNSLIKKASSELSAKKYEESRVLFIAAAEIRPDDTVVKAKLAEIDAILLDITANQKEQDERLARFDALMAQARQHNKGGLGEQALAAVNEALVIQESSKDAKNLKREIEARVQSNEKEALAASAKRIEFNQAIKIADQLYSEEKWKESKTSYLSAQKILKEEQHPKDRIALIDQKLKDQAELAADVAKKEHEYKKALAAGQKAIDGGNWDEAKKELTVATSLKPDEQEPKNLLAQIDEHTALVAKKEKEAMKKAVQLAAMINAGKASIKAGNLEQAGTVVNEALSLSPDNPEVMSLKTALDKGNEAKAKAAADELAQEEKARKEAERLAKLEADRLAKEEAELAANELKLKEQVEEAKLAELASAAAEQAKADQQERERLAKEAEEKAAKEEEVRLAAAKKAEDEAAALAAEIEAERQKRLEAGRAEAQRITAEEAERLAAEKAKLAEEKRIADEAAKSKAKEESERLAAAQAKIDEEKVNLKSEAERLRKEAESARMAAVKEKEEIERLAAEVFKQEQEEARAEQARIAADKKADKERLANLAKQEERERKASEKARKDKHRSEELEAQKAKTKAEAEEQQRIEQKEIAALKVEQDLVAEHEALVMEEEATDLLASEMAREESRMKAIVEAQVRKEMEAEYNDDIKQIKRDRQLVEQTKRQQNRDEELAARKLERTREIADARAEAARRNSEKQILQERAKQEKRIEEQQALQEPRIAKLDEELKREAKRLELNREKDIINAERLAEEVAEKEARRLEVERQTASAKEENIRRMSEIEKERVERKVEEEENLDEKTANAALRKQEADRERIKAAAERRAEKAMLANAAREKDHSEERLRLERERKAAEERVLKDDNFRAKKEFAEKAKEMAKSNAASEKSSYEDEVRGKIQAEYDAKRAAFEKTDSERESLTPFPVATKFQLDLGKQYPLGITEESMVKDNRDITRIIVNREGIADDFQRVKWHWGGVYYFKNGESTSKRIYDQGITW